MAEIKVSIILPVYNKEKYLRVCLESIFKQTLREIEIICIDDGSADNSLEILKELAEFDNRIILITRENHGAGYSRNEGISVARGEYIQFLDADDFFEPDMLEILYSKAKKCNADIVISDANRYNNETGTFGSNTYLVKPNTDKEVFSYKDVEDIFTISPGVVWNKLYLREFIHDRKIQFQNIFCKNDFAFAYLALCEAERISYVTDCLVHYRFEGNSDSITAKRGEHLECSILAYKHLQAELIRRGKYVEVQDCLQKKMIDVINYELPFQKDMSKRFEFIKEATTLLEERWAYEAKKLTAFLIVQEDEKFWSVSNIGFPTKECSVFGTGRNGAECCNVLNRLNIKVKDIYDNNEKKQGCEYYGCMIKNPTEINEGSLPIIVASTKYEREISRQLEHEYGLEKGKGYYLFSEIRDKVGKVAVEYLNIVYGF